MESTTKSELDKLLTGEIYRYDTPEIAARKDRASAGCVRLNACDPLDVGKNITCGDRCTFNYNVTVLDGAPVRFGNNCMVGPGCLITTTGHPLTAAGRRNREAFSRPVTIGNDVWLGGNVTVLPGVTIGDNVVVGAGAVVTHDIPSNSLAVGVPARVVRSLEEE